MARGGMLSRMEELQYSYETDGGAITIGIDLGDQYSHCCLLGQQGRVLTQGRIRTTREGFSRHFQGLPPTRIAIEVGAHSRWVSLLLKSWGHEVLVANTCAVQLIASSRKKSDKADAEVLARLARADPKLLAPIQHSNQDSYADMATINARDLLVRNRARLINAIRGMVKTTGLRLPTTMSAAAFAPKVEPLVPEELRPCALPLLQTISFLTAQIRMYEKQLDKIAEAKYPATKALRQVDGVGPITALRYVLTLGDPHRFRKSRDVACYVGLVPGKRQSGEMDLQMRISKTGSVKLRVLLVQCAQYVMGRFGPDCDLKRWGAVLASRGGKNGRKRAIVAVARKLSVLLHKLWVTGEKYEPLFNTRRITAIHNTSV